MKPFPSHISASADFSEDTEGPDGRGKYRYTLWRKNLCDRDDFLMFVCLNPSTADESQDDPTVRRCWMRAARLGYGAFVMTNLFAFRATEPKDMKAAADPIGDWNDDWITTLASKAGEIVLGWGGHGDHLERDMEVLRLLEPHLEKLRYLRLSLNSSPYHPLYQPDDMPLSPVKPFWRNILQRSVT